MHYRTAHSKYLHTILWVKQRRGFGLVQHDLILISCVLTALNLYAPLANWGGAGALVPITGFANGVCSSACEFQVEGQVFGIGCQIFRIAGPVILYGIFSSWLLGVIYLVVTGL